MITGASSGIGAALALRYAEGGYHVVLSARGIDRLEDVAAQIKQKGREVLAVSTDVAIREQCEAMVQASLERFGRIDVLINNAGISMRALLQDADPSVIEQVMAVNFNGTLYCTKSALPALLESKGSIIGISSVAGFRGLPGRSGYCASKFAMHGFLETIRTELLQKGVHVLLACPGFTASNIRNVALDASGNQQKENPLDEGKLMSAEQVADLIFRAHQSRKRTLVLTAQGKFTVWLNKLFPSWMDRIVWRHYSKEPGLNL